MRTPHPGAKYLSNLIAWCIVALTLTNTATAQTDYIIEFTNDIGCDFRASLYIDEAGDYCTSSSTVGSWEVTVGNTVTCEFTIPAGYVFCYWEFVELPYPPGGIYDTTTGGDPCAWNLSGYDLCNTQGNYTVACKGNCDNARCTVE